MNYFYYIGFLYIIDSIKTLWRSLHPTTDQSKILKIDTKMDASELMNTAQTFKTNNKINTLQYIVGTIFFIWAIIGYLSNTPQKYLFLADVVVIILYWSFIFFIGMYFAYNSMFKNKAEVYNDIKKPTINLPIGKIMPIIELIIVSSILYNHFFII